MNGTPLRAPELSNASVRADSRSCCTRTSIWTSANIRSPIVARCIPVLGNAIVGSHLVAPRPNPDSWAPASVVQRLDLGTRQLPSLGLLHYLSAGQRRPSRRSTTCALQYF